MFCVYGFYAFVYDGVDFVIFFFAEGFNFPS